LQQVFYPPTAETDYVGGELIYEVRGPNHSGHLWSASNEGEIVPDISHNNVRRIWTVQAQLALSGWLALKAALSEDTSRW